MKAFLIAWVFVLYFGSAIATFDYFICECPGGMKPGMVWFPKGSCQRCRCFENGYGCDDCEDDVPHLLIDGCYKVKTKVDKSSNYPRCCPISIFICKGDKNFDQSAFEKFIAEEKTWNIKT